MIAVFPKLTTATGASLTAFTTIVIVAIVEVKPVLSFIVYEIGVVVPLKFATGVKVTIPEEFTVYVPSPETVNDV